MKILIIYVNVNYLFIQFLGISYLPLECLKIIQHLVKKYKKSGRIISKAPKPPCHPHVKINFFPKFQFQPKCSHHTNTSKSGKP